MDEVVDWVLGVPSWHTAEEWSAIAAWVAILLAAAAAWFAAAQLLDARRVRREVAAPYVLVQLDSSEASSKLLDFVVSNIGQTPALDVRLHISPPMVRADEIAGFHFMDAKPIRDGIKMLAPGQVIRMHFDSVVERDQKKKDLPSAFEVRVEGKDSRGRALPVATYTLDADWGRDSVHVDVHNLHWIGTRIENIEKVLGKIANSLGK